MKLIFSVPILVRQHFALSSFRGSYTCNSSLSPTFTYPCLMNFDVKKIQGKAVHYYESLSIFPYSCELKMAYPAPFTQVSRIGPVSVAGRRSIRASHTIRDGVQASAIQLDKFPRACNAFLDF